MSDFVLPQCICQGRQLQQGCGGYFGPGLSYTPIECKRCGRVGTLVHAISTSLAVLWVAEFEAAATEWINKVFLKRINKTEEFARKGMSEEEQKKRPAPELPQIPIGVSVLRHEGDHWTAHTYESTKDIKIPDDPLLTWTRNYWREVISQLETATGLVATNLVEIRNCYDGDESEPWLTFNLRDYLITVGWRKRVTVLEWTPGTPAPLLRAQAEKDNVTVYTNGVHAWSKEKMIAYMKLLVEDLFGSAAKEEAGPRP